MRCCLMADEEILRRQAERHFLSEIESARAAEDVADLAHAGNKPSSIHAKLDALVAEARGKLRRRA
jgi:hypothetical protein